MFNTVVFVLFCFVLFCFVVVFVGDDGVVLLVMMRVMLVVYFLNLSQCLLFWLA